MAFLNAKERAVLQAVADVTYTNPFVPEHPELERAVLGRDFVESGAVWNMRGDDLDMPNVNPQRIVECIEPLIQTLRDRFAHGTDATDTDFSLYEDAVFYVLFYRYEDDFYDVIIRSASQKTIRCPFYADFLRDWTFYFHVPGFASPTKHDVSHIFAVFFQARRAFHHIFRYLIGGSAAAVRFRAAVWQSIFTHDLRRYRRVLYKQMGDFTTLITGPSGTGKELVATAIGLSRYIPFDAQSTTFSETFSDTFHALNLSAMPSTLIESELFGHRRGAFTGATENREGWLERCQPLGTIFLDEIGDLDASIQVKLLRVLQMRTFQPLGDTTERIFHGKLIAATNRDLEAAMQQGEFREDFYYRLCSDLIVTPSLQEQLHEAPEALPALLSFIAQRILGSEAEALVVEVENWIVQHLGSHYAWPGNIRELEQCVRNILIRKDYRPSRGAQASRGDALHDALRDVTLTADDLLRQYCTIVFAQTGNYVETARRLQLDRRTVKSKVDPDLLAQFRNGDA